MDFLQADFLQDITVTPEEAREVVPLCVPKAEKAQRQRNERRFWSAVRYVRHYLEPISIGGSILWRLSCPLDLIAAILHHDSIQEACATIQSLRTELKIATNTELWTSYSGLARAVPTTVAMLDKLETGLSQCLREDCYFDGEFDGGKSVILGKLGQRAAIAHHKNRLGDGRSLKGIEECIAFDNLLDEVADRFSPQLRSLGVDEIQRLYSPHNPTDGVGYLVLNKAEPLIKVARA